MSRPSTTRRETIPAYAGAVLAALSFAPSDRSPALRTLSDGDWERALRFCDMSHLSLPLYLRCAEHLPPSIASRLRNNLDGNARRWERLKDEYRAIAAALQEHRIEFTVLKGFSQWPLFVDHPAHRAQYDLDLLLRPDQAREAARVAGLLGYEPSSAIRRELPTDHLPTLIRKTGWTWRDDYYDPDIPFSLELHFRCWSEPVERFGPRGLEQVLQRRVCTRHCDGLIFPSLHPADSVLYASLHVLRHLLRGSLRVSHVYEMGYFLHQHAGDDRFWQQWNALHDAPLQRLEAICFSLAHRWFACRLHPTAQHAVTLLPADVARWLHHYSHSPLATLFRPNKDELWLHWCLVNSSAARASILKRKFIPSGLPGAVSGVYIPRTHWTWKLRWKNAWSYLHFVIKRLQHHAGALLPTAASGLYFFGAGRLQQHRSLLRKT